MKFYKRLTAFFFSLVVAFSLSVNTLAAESYTDECPNTEYILATWEYSDEDTERFSIPLPIPSSSDETDAQLESIYKLYVDIIGNKATKTITAKVTNEFAVGFSSIDITLEFYSERGKELKLRGSAHDNDLNLGESLSVSHTGIRESAKYYVVLKGTANGEKLNYSTSHVPFNKKAEKYPTDIKSPVTGESLPYYFSMTLQKIPEDQRVVWNTSTRNAYEKHLGVSLKGYEVHHIIPRAYGGTNIYTNLIPLDPTDHTKVTTWWVNY